MEVMKTLPDNSIDAVITDPPYLITDLSFDDKLSFGWITELLRVVKPNGYLCTFGLSKIQREVEKHWAYRFSGIWLKEKGGMRTHSAKMPMCQQEPFVVYAHPDHSISNLIWNSVYREGKSYHKVQKNLGYKRGGKDQLDRANTSSWTKEGYISENDGRREMTDVLFGTSKGSMKHKERTNHPTQKPLLVIQTQMLWLTNPGDTILDPFMGSGTTGVVCIQTGRNFIGIEINPDYFEMAQARIKDAQKQPSLLSIGT